MDTETKKGIDAAKTACKRVVQNTAEATGDLMGNKIGKSKEKEKTKKGPIHKGCPHIRGEWSKSGQMRTGGGGRVVSQMWTSAWKKNYSYHICEIYSDNLAVCLYKIFILLLFNKECMERNEMTSFRILSWFECFLRFFQTRITTINFDWQKTRTYFSNNNIVLFVFLLFYVTGAGKWNIFFFQRMILEHLHFCLANHACVSHHYQNCLIGTHM